MPKSSSLLAIWLSELTWKISQSALHPCEKMSPFLSVCWRKNPTSSKSFGKASAPRQPDPTLRNERVGCLLVAVDVRGGFTFHSEHCPFTVDGKEKFAIFSCFVGTFGTFHLGKNRICSTSKNLQTSFSFWKFSSLKTPSSKMNQAFIEKKHQKKWDPEAEMRKKWDPKKNFSHGVIMPCQWSMANASTF